MIKPKQYSPAAHLFPGAMEQRAREFNARMVRLSKSASQVPICNANTPGSYRTGDGETVQQVRPGSMHAYTLPSRGIGV